jgi:peptidoglycan-associated lipoprotein
VPPVQELTFEPVYFEFDSYVVSSAAQGVLRKLAGGLKSGSGTKIQIEGHCDERGSNEYNLALGERRARSVKDFLVGEGVMAESVSTISFGEEKPAAQGTGEEAWGKNRRAEIKKM